MTDKKVIDMRNIEAKFGSKQKRLNGVCIALEVLGTIMLQFHFGGREHSVVVKIVL